MAPYSSAEPTVSRHGVLSRTLSFGRPRFRGKYVLPTLLLLGVILLNISIGAVPLSLQEILAILLQPLGLPMDAAITSQEQLVLLNIRLPRICFGLLTGAGLAVSGAVIQGVFRNPLAEPGLIGVSTSSALAAAITLYVAPLISSWLPEGLMDLFLPIAAFLGGLTATWIVYLLAQSSGKVHVATLLLAGIAINAISAAGIGLISYFADDAVLRSITFWNLGSLGGANWQRVWILGVFTILPTLVLTRYARALNAFALGEREAWCMGIEVERTKRLLILLSALVVGACVSATGTIGFIGLVVPHLLRLIFGANYRHILPLTALGGATLLLLTDVLARTLVVPSELPIGILTALIGGPFLIGLLLKNKRNLTL